MGSPSIDDVQARQREVLDRARPLDRRVHRDRWTANDFSDVQRTQMLASFWGSEVPGSGAYDEMLTGAVVAADDLGWDVSLALDVVGDGWAALGSGAGEAVLASKADDLFNALEEGRRPSPRPTAPAPPAEESVPIIQNLDGRMLASWQGKIAGGAFGTALEGCRGDAIASVYGDVRAYVAEPNTLNDDVVYELVALNVLEAHRRPSTEIYAREWSVRIPFGWSAEWVVLDNLARGLSMPQAAVVRNPFTDWIGAQMRSMVFGQLCPGRPLIAASMARIEAAVSHRGDGIEGAAFSAMLSALAFTNDDPHRVVTIACDLLAPSSYRREIERCVEICRTSATFDDVWPEFAVRHQDHNWIHAVPNIGAVIASLWFGDGNLTESFALLARAGLDVDCNAGLVGTILGAMTGGVPDAWAVPLHDRIDTYLPSVPTVAISSVADQTLRDGRLLLR